MSKVVESLISDAIDKGDTKLVRGMVYMNEHPQLKPYLEWIAVNDQFFKASMSRTKLPDNLIKSYAEFIITLSGFTNGLALAAKDEDVKAKNS